MIWVVLFVYICAVTGVLMWVRPADDRDVITKFFLELVFFPLELAFVVGYDIVWKKVKRVLHI